MMFTDKQVLVIPLYVFIMYNNISNSVVSKHRHIYVVYGDDEKDLLQGLSSNELECLKLVHWNKHRGVREALVKIAHKILLARHNIVYIAYDKFDSEQVRGEGFNTILAADLEYLER